MENFPRQMPLSKVLKVIGQGVSIDWATSTRCVLIKVKRKETYQCVAGRVAEDCLRNSERHAALILFYNLPDAPYTVYVVMDQQGVFEYTIDILYW